MNYKDELENAIRVLQESEQKRELMQSKRSTDRTITAAFWALIIVATLEIVYASVYFSIGQPVMGVFMLAKSGLLFFGAFWLKRI